VSTTRKGVWVAEPTYRQQPHSDVTESPVLHPCYRAVEGGSEKGLITVIHLRGRAWRTAIAILSTIEPARVIGGFYPTAQSVCRSTRRLCQKQLINYSCLSDVMSRYISMKTSRIMRLTMAGDGISKRSLCINLRKNFRSPVTLNWISVTYPREFSTAVSLGGCLDYRTPSSSGRYRMPNRLWQNAGPCFMHMVRSVCPVDSIPSVRDLGGESGHDWETITASFSPGN
jgi:hypothetical protein